MTVYRLSYRKRIEDMSGKGAELHGGRWNKVGTPVVYAAESRALAVLEFLVHAQLADLPTTLAFVAIELPTKASVESFSTDVLPASWRDAQPAEELAKMGTAWANTKVSLVLKVPSVIIPSEFNIVLNPRHKQFANVKVSKPEPFSFDDRLLRLKQ
jgi:RES domain-containing protein